MNITQAKSNAKIERKGRKRLGRGDASGHGGTSCKGHKGQNARSGYHRRPYFEGGQMPLIRRLPKRGFSNVIFKEKVAIVNLETLNRFKDGTEITPQFLCDNGVIKKAFNAVKILGRGELTKKLSIQAHAFSEGVQEKIQKAGGTCKVITA
jgi:large subunit ribosomal protein L15